MTTNINYQSIENKLGELKTAVMYSMSNSIKKLPNDVVGFYKVDEEGKIWFTAHKPKGWIRNYDYCFPAKLFFYRKNVDFYMEIDGTVVFASKDEVMNCKDELTEKSLLLKITPKVIEYTETGKKNLFQDVSRFFSNFYNGLSEMLPIPFSAIGQAHK